MAKRRQHWMDEVANSVRERIAAAVPSVAEGIVGDVPFGHRPQTPDDQVKTFLHLDPQQRQQLFASMSPDEYKSWSSGMMKKLTTRFGAAAQVLMPMLEGTPVEGLAQGQGLDAEGSLGVSSAQAELSQLLGFDPFADEGGS